MTWSMFAINYLSIDDTIKADLHFRNGFEKYIQKPFLVWREVAAMDGPKNETFLDQSEERGAVNFLTAAGGFLQSILFGYSGVRVLNDRMEINEPRLLPTTNGLVINGIKYRGLSIDLIVREEEEVKRNDLHRFSLRFRECSAVEGSIALIINDAEEIIVNCGAKKWCKYGKWCTEMVIGLEEI